jgi:hypothetical protein
MSAAKKTKKKSAGAFRTTKPPEERRKKKAVAKEQQDDGLSQDNPPPLRSEQDNETIQRGQEAFHRQQQAWDDWLAIGEVLLIGQQEAMARAKTNKPQGRKYQKAIEGWLVANGFKGLAKDVRSRLLKCLELRDDIEKWRATLTEEQRLRYNHPNTVLRKFESYRKPTPKPEKTQKPKSQVAKLEESVARLEEENHDLRRRKSKEPSVANKDAAAEDTKDKDTRPHSPDELQVWCKATIDEVFSCLARLDANPRADVLAYIRDKVEAWARPTDATEADALAKQQADTQQKPVLDLSDARAVSAALDAKAEADALEYVKRQAEAKMTATKAA